MLSGTLAVTRVPWASPTSESQMLTASSGTASTHKVRQQTPQDLLRDKLLAELQEKNPNVALTHLQEETTKRPSLAKHCASIARALGRAAVAKYGAAHRAQAYSRPVCDTSFASGVATAQ